MNTSVVLFNKSNEVIYTNSLAHELKRIGIENPTKVATSLIDMKGLVSFNLKFLASVVKLVYDRYDNANISDMYSKDFLNSNGEWLDRSFRYFAKLHNYISETGETIRKVREDIDVARAIFTADFIRYFSAIVQFKQFNALRWQDQTD